MVLEVKVLPEDGLWGQWTSDSDGLGPLGRLYSLPWSLLSSVLPLLPPDLHLPRRDACFRLDNGFRCGRRL